MLPRFPVGAGATVSRLPGGLINQTFLVDDGGERFFVLQRVSPVFPVTIHDDIVAVTEALDRAGVTTPRVIPAHDRRPYLELPPIDAERGEAGGEPPATSVWRLMSYVDGVAFDVIGGPTQARAAGGLVARFHAALDGLSHRFSRSRLGVHDTPLHLSSLRRSVREHPFHRLIAEVAPLARAIDEGARSLPVLPALPARICHGDLKLNNLLFAGPGAGDRDRAICLVDLDTVGPMALAHELGDAWRSWCNRAGEDREVADLDLVVFEASLDGYREGLGRSLTPDERSALLLGPEWISLELAARFAADALAERYFGWDAASFAGRGEHNLVRARGQWSLHRALVDSRPRRARALDLAGGGTAAP